MAIHVLHDLLKSSADNFPDKTAVFYKDKILTYKKLYEDSQRLQTFLIKSGVEKGDRVAIYLEKRFEKVVSIFAVSMSGAIFVPMRRLLQEYQVGHIVSNCEAKALITTADRLPYLLKVKDKLKSIKTIISISPDTETPEQIMEGVQIINWRLALLNSQSVIPNSVIESDLAAILYTSGSTGNPKGVVLSHLNLIAGAQKVSEYLKISANDRLLSILTFAFDYGLNQLTSAVLMGAQLVLLDYLFPRDIISVANKFEVTGIAAVATTWIQLLQGKWDQNDLPNLRYITNSGGAIPEFYVREIRKRIPKTDIYLMYGLTEAFRSTYLDPRLVDERPTSMGKAIPGEEILILGDNYKPVKAGEIGQLVHRGILVAQGYWNAPDLTAERYKENPLQPKEVPVKETVVFSGDYVKVDQKGFLYFIGRKDEMIKSAGNRISPTEIEEVLYATGKIQDAVVMGIPHKIYGQVVKAIVVLKNGLDISKGDLLSECKKLLPPYMIPADIEIRPKLPVNANGKLDRATIKTEVLNALNKDNTND